MTYAKPFLRLVLQGYLYNEDVWSLSMSLIANVDGANPPDEVPPALISAVQAYWAGSTPIVSAHASVATIKLNEIGTNGKYTSPTTVLYDFDPRLNGTGGSTPAPQVSLAISLTTAIARGRAHAGRYYLPIPAPQAQATGRLSAQAVGEQVSAAQTFLEAVNAAVPGYDVGVTSNLGTGTQQLVTGVRVGDVLDTIRSRRSAFQETYQSLPVVGP